MENIQSDGILHLMVEMLKHIESVQNDIIKLSEHSTISFHEVLQSHNLATDEKAIKAFQYQDIITQQLNATCEAIEASKNSINIYLHAVKQDKNMLDESIEKLLVKLKKSLELAQKKQDAFGGDALESKKHGNVEFF